MALRRTLTNFEKYTVLPVCRLPRHGGRGWTGRIIHSLKDLSNHGNEIIFKGHRGHPRNRNPRRRNRLLQQVRQEQGAEHRIRCLHQSLHRRHNLRQVNHPGRTGHGHPGRRTGSRHQGWHPEFHPEHQGNHPLALTQHHRVHPRARCPQERPVLHWQAAPRENREDCRQEVQGIYIQVHDSLERGRPLRESGDHHLFFAGVSLRRRHGSFDRRAPAGKSPGDGPVRLPRQVGRTERHTGGGPVSFPLRDHRPVEGLQGQEGESLHETGRHRVRHGLEG